MANNVKLIYNDIALGAADDATVTTIAEGYTTPSAILKGVDPPAIATAELNGWGLTHDYKARGTQPLAFWSTARSGEDCVFATPPTITVDFGSQYTATGLTLRFSPASMDYCRKVSVQWYQGATLKSSGTFYPDYPIYIINRTVEAFDRVVIALEETNLPGKRAKLEKLTVGAEREINSRELTNVKFLYEVDLISDTLPSNLLDASFHSNWDVDFVFQRKQPVYAYNGDKLAGVYYIKSGRQTGGNTFSVACQDLLGVLDLRPHSGGIWLSDTPLTTILNDVFGDAVVFDIAPEYAGATLRGFIEPETTSREALQQIAFALGACVDTTGTEKVKIFPPPTGTGAEIDPRKTYIGGAVDTEDVVTEVTVTAYIISDERPGEDDEYIEFNGEKYKYYTDTKHAYNPNTVSTDLENKIKFVGMYLCNNSNAQTIADNILARYMRRKKYSFTHVTDGEEVSDRATAQLPWGEIANGNITKMTVTVTGLSVSETEMLIGGDNSATIGVATLGDMILGV